MRLLLLLSKEGRVEGRKSETVSAQRSNRGIKVGRGRRESRGDHTEWGKGLTKYLIRSFCGRSKTRGGNWRRVREKLAEKGRIKKPLASKNKRMRIRRFL